MGGDLQMVRIQLSVCYPEGDLKCYA